MISLTKHKRRTAETCKCLCSIPRRIWPRSRITNGASWISHFVRPPRVSVDVSRQQIPGFSSARSAFAIFRLFWLIFPDSRGPHWPNNARTTAECLCSCCCFRIQTTKESSRQATLGIPYPPDHISCILVSSLRSRLFDDVILSRWLASLLAERRPVAMRNAALSVRNLKRSLRVLETLGVDPNLGASADLMGQVILYVLLTGRFRGRS